MGVKISDYIPDIENFFTDDQIKQMLVHAGYVFDDDSYHKGLIVTDSFIAKDKGIDAEVYTANVNKTTETRLEKVSNFTIVNNFTEPSFRSCFKKNVDNLISFKEIA